MPRRPLPIIAPREGRARRLDPATLIAVAGELVDRDGLNALTIAALADAVGVKPPSLYAHVRSLQAVRQMIAALGLQELEHALARASVGRSGDEAIGAICRAYREYALERPGVYAATVMWTGEKDDAVEAAGAALKATVLQILSPSKMDHAEQIHLLRLMRISLHGFVALEAAHAFGEPVDIEETFARLVDLLTGLARSGARRASA